MTLVGIGMGARLMFHCLLELSRMAADGAPARGLVENVVLLGTPVSCRPERWAAGERAAAARAAAARAAAARAASWAMAGAPRGGGGAGAARPAGGRVEPLPSPPRR